MNKITIHSILSIMFLDIGFSMKEEGNDWMNSDWMTSGVYVEEKKHEPIFSKEQAKNSLLTLNKVKGEELKNKYKRLIEKYSKGYTEVVIHGDSLNKGIEFAKKSHLQELDHKIDLRLNEIDKLMAEVIKIQKDEIGIINKLIEEYIKPEDKKIVFNNNPEFFIKFLSKQTKEYPDNINNITAYINLIQEIEKKKNEISKIDKERILAYSAITEEYNNYFTGMKVDEVDSVEEQS